MHSKHALDALFLPCLCTQWRAFAADLATAERAAAVAEGGFAFAFVEGKLVQALREGWWLLLDEINLVSFCIFPRTCMCVCTNRTPLAKYSIFV